MEIQKFKHRISRPPNMLKTGTFEITAYVFIPAKMAVIKILAYTCINQLVST